MNTISSRQKAVLDCIKQHIEANPYPPTVREIADKLKLGSPATIQTHIKNLTTLGFLSKKDGQARSLALTEKAFKLYEKKNDFNGRSFGSRTEAAAIDSKPAGLPLLGRVAAGGPILADENIEDYYPLPSSHSKDGSFLLRVEGDSMINAGIFAGDLIIVRQQSSADNGDIVVALLDDEATVKTLYFEDEGIRLQPENPAYKPIYSQDARIIGKVVGLLRLKM